METLLQKELRIQNKTQADVVRATGLDRGYVSKVVRGKKLPRVPNADKIARFLERSIEEVFSDQWKRNGR